MPDQPFSVADFLAEYGERLTLDWLAGEPAGDVPLVPHGEGRQPLISHLNPIQPPCIQIIGPNERHYFETLGHNSQSDLLKQLLSGRSRLIIVTDDLDVPDSLRKGADKAGVALFTTPSTDREIIDYLGHHLSRRLSQRRVLHGVFMEVIGMGVLITGPSGIGKSELALELVTRGQRLVADDAPEFVRNAPDSLRGYCPEVLRDFLEVRGLGVLDIRAMFGDQAVRYEKNLHLIVRLVQPDDACCKMSDRIRGNRAERTILGVRISEICLPVAAGRDLAVLIEAAARSQLLYYNGYDSAEAFIRRQHQLMDS